MLRLSWFISLGISLFGVLIIEYFFTMQPDEVASSGNLGALGLALVLPFVALSLFITFRFFTQFIRTRQDMLSRSIAFIFSVALAIVLFIYAKQYGADVYDSLGGTTHDKQSIIYGFPALNEYTNRVFINFYTFALVHTVAAFIGIVYGLVKPVSSTPIEDASEGQGE